MKKGYIKLYRQIQDNPLYKEKTRFRKNEAWIDLLLSAHHKSDEIVVGLKKIPVKKGEVFTSQLRLSKRWNWGIASVSRFLNFLKNGNQITYKAESKFTIISIVNWNKYQAEEKETETKKRDKLKPNGNQTEIVKNVKECKRITTKVGKQSFPKGDYLKVHSAYKETKGVKPQGKEWNSIDKAILTMFQSGRTPEQIIEFMRFVSSLKENQNKDLRWLWANWTIWTIQKKLPEFLAGKYQEADGRDYLKRMGQKTKDLLKGFPK